MAIQIGDIVGDYQVTGVLGRGGMGKVYRVRSLLTDREEAMKVVLPDLNEDPELADRFLREIKVHASLQHPNIAALHTALRLGDRLVMILELVDGVSLEETLRLGPMAPSVAVHYLDQVLAALAFAHDRGVIHRDVKPANILISAGGAVKLTDFGIARASGGPRLTGTGVALGTLNYMSPEQIRSGQVDARSDLYSLGATAYEMVTGRRPIQGDSEHAIMNAHLHTVPPDPATINPDAPAVLCAAIMRALSKDPGLRFPTAREFQSALQDLGHTTARASFTAAASPVDSELSELEVRLSRAIGPIAKRLVAEAARRYSTTAEIRQVLAGQIDDAQERAAFLKTGPVTTVAAPVSSPVPAAMFDPAMLERLAQSLAPYIGPVAKVVVTRAARKARSAEELHTALAAEIEPEADRRRFLAVVASLL